MGNVERPAWEPKQGYALIVTIVDRDGEVPGKEIWWPLTPGAIVTAPAGLRGLLWGAGDGDVFDYFAAEATWLVAEVEEVKVVKVKGMVEFTAATVVYVGGKEAAIGLVQEHAPQGTPVNWGTRLAGNDEVAVTGLRGTSSARCAGKAVAGDLGKAVAGDLGMAVAGCAGRAVAGFQGVSIVGGRGVAVTGSGGVAIAGDQGVVAGGAGALLVVDDHTADGALRRVVGVVGCDGIDAGVSYCVGRGGRLVRASDHL